MQGKPRYCKKREGIKEENMGNVFALRQPWLDQQNHVPIMQPL